LDEQIHVVPPKGEEEDGWVWQLQKAPYGTRRASFLFQQFVRRRLCTWPETALRFRTR
jgi:hypothetical protein